MHAPDGPIATLCKHLHAEILRVLHPSRDVPPMTWQEFQERAGLDRWDRNSHWKLKEGQLRWGPDRLIAIARRLGIPVEIRVGVWVGYADESPPAAA